jgi:phosphoribosyl 1,2-cyclic phosphate phosphodiesterase
MTLTFTILGCGSSAGVPRIGQGWGACDPNEPKNRRRRCSLLVERSDGAGRTTVLIDTSPDLRAQLLDAGIRSLDGVLYTHDHADHTHGIDDLRPLALFLGRRIDVHADAETSALLWSRFGYCFATPPGSEYPPFLAEHRIAAGKPVIIAGEGGRNPRAAVHAGAWGPHFAGISHRRPRLFLRRERPAAGKRGRARRPRCLGSRCLALPPASEPFLGG